MIRYPSIRYRFDTCGKRPQARPVVAWEQLTLLRAFVIVGDESMECETGSPVRGRGAVSPIQYRFLTLAPQGGRYKPHRPVP